MLFSSYCYLLFSLLILVLPFVSVTSYHYSFRFSSTLYSLLPSSIFFHYFVYWYVSFLPLCLHFNFCQITFSVTSTFYPLLSFPSVTTLFLLFPVLFFLFFLLHYFYSDSLCHSFLFNPTLLSFSLSLVRPLLLFVPLLLSFPLSLIPPFISPVLLFSLSLIPPLPFCVTFVPRSFFCTTFTYISFCHPFFSSVLYHLYLHSLCHEFLLLFHIYFYVLCHSFLLFRFVPRLFLVPPFVPPLLTFPFVTHYSLPFCTTFTYILFVTHSSFFRCVPPLLPFSHSLIPSSSLCVYIVVIIWERDD